ncbi:hypothetical protein ACOZ4N_14060 [Halorientalis pallida]|uniref:hypothetical protein n=1 Tax=Halorientalis pallida TaxID=2479928 RepID=UPI003C6EEA89
MTDRTADLDVYDHVRPTDDAIEPGVYRVVGTTGDGVTLLQVADADGTRRHTGTVVTVGRDDLSGLEPAANPDENRSIGAWVTGQLEGFYWSLRVLAGTVRERPILGTVALAAMTVGLFGDPFVPIPDAGDVLLFLAGAVGLVVLSRRGAA